MGHLTDGRSREVQPKGCDVTMLNYVSSFSIVINALSLYSMWNI